MEERENIRRSKNKKLLSRAKQKDKAMEEMVKDFVTKLENERVSCLIRSGKASKKLQMQSCCSSSETCSDKDSNLS